jgi:hypothetical protein
MLKNGINNCGAYEKLFYEFRSTNDYTVFNDDNLIAKFSQSAVINSKKGSFIEHFKSVINRLSLESSNYFKDIILGTNCPTFVYPRPSYLDNLSSVSNDSLIEKLNRVYFEKIDLESMLMTKNQRYTFINVSNILDWCNRETIYKILLYASYSLEDYGTLLLRQLNSVHDFDEILPMFFGKTDQHIDCSCLYKKTTSCYQRFEVPKILLNVNKFDSHTYISSLNTNSLDFVVFRDFQTAFCHAVYKWIQTLVEVIALLDNKEHRKILIDNVRDEFGNGNYNDNHTVTFYSFLKHLNYDGSHPLLSHCQNSKVQAFIDNLDTILNKNITYVTAFLGIIEYIYIYVSDVTCKYIKENNNKCNDSFSNSHYSLHGEIDYKHSRDLFYVSQSTMHTNKNFINGVVDGYNSFMNMFSAP